MSTVGVSFETNPMNESPSSPPSSPISCSPSSSGSASHEEPSVLLPRVERHPLAFALLSALLISRSRRIPPEDEGPQELPLSAASEGVLRAVLAIARRFQRSARRYLPSEVSLSVIGVDLGRCLDGRSDAFADDDYGPHARALRALGYALGPLDSLTLSSDKPYRLVRKPPFASTGLP